jgi:hypothetical protein
VCASALSPPGDGLNNLDVIPAALNSGAGQAGIHLDPYDIQRFPLEPTRGEIGRLWLLRFRDLAGKCSCISGIPAIHGRKKMGRVGRP